METKEETKIGLEESDHHLVQLDVGAESVSFKRTLPEMLDDRIPEIPSGKSHHLFISHSEEDAEWVEKLVKDLEENHGVKCLWPKRDFLAGQGIPGLIQRGIAESMKVVFVLTPDSLESPWCEQERDWAIVLSMEERQNRIIPLLLKPCKIPDIFSTFNYIDVPKGEDYVNRTIRALAGTDLSDLQPRVVNFLRTQGSGLGMEVYANKYSAYMCRGPSWAFGDLTESQRRTLSRLGSENEKQLRDAIQGHSVRNVMKTKILINYINDFWQPKLQLMYYDLSPCLKHATDVAMNRAYFVRFETETLEKFKARAKTFAEQRLRGFILRNTDYLFAWNSLPESVVHRHATFQNKMCVCELMSP